MCDVGFFPICIQCGTGKHSIPRGGQRAYLTSTDQNPCHVKVVGPTLGFILGVGMAIVCWPAALFCGCCATEAGKKFAKVNVESCVDAYQLFRTLGLPADTSRDVGNAIPF